MVTLTLFGSMTLARDGIAMPLTGRCACLLAYLALHAPRPVARTELLEHVWADRCDRLNASTLSTALWRLRTQLAPFAGPEGDLLLCDGAGSVQLNPAIDLRLDVASFEREVDAALRLDVDELGPHRPRLEAALALYRSDLLLDHHDEWILRERERLRRLHLNGLGRLLEHATRIGHHVQAIAHAQAILDHEPLREDIHCALMRAQWAAGQRAMALRQFEACRALLRRELAIAPMPDTLALYRRIAESGLGDTRPGERRVAGSDVVPDRRRPSATVAPRRVTVELRSACSRGGRRRRAAATDGGPQFDVAEASARRLAGTTTVRAWHQFDAARRSLETASERLREGLALFEP